MRQRDRNYRAWRPGDGLTCSLQGRAAKDLPCGPPVLVGEVPVDDRLSKSTSGRRKELLCENHVASRFLPGGIGVLNQRLDTEAREAVLAAHWDEYQAERAKRRQGVMDEITAAIPEQFRGLVAAALAAHSREADAAAELKEG